MAVSIPVTWTDAHRLHDPETAVWVGVPIPADELPERADAIRGALEEAGARSCPPLFTRTTGRGMGGEGEGGGEGMSVGNREGEGGGGEERGGRGGGGGGGGQRAAYACCRPPGHHVTRKAFGGSCYLNNSAVAAQYLRDGGCSRVAVLDIDAHHGNGAQAIFRERGDMLTGSVHVDPARGWFPHFLGFADERGGGAGDGANLNVPLEPGSGDEVWLAGVDLLLEAARTHQSEALVVPLGVDAAAGDPNSPLRVTEAGFREAGLRLGALGLPTVLVQEGGYVLDTIGSLVRATLEGFEAGAS